MRPSAGVLQSLKQGLLDASFRTSTRQHRRRQLLRVADKSSRTTRTKPSEGYQRRRLRRLSGFVDDDEVKQRHGAANHGSLSLFARGALFHTASSASTSSRAGPVSGEETCTGQGCADNLRAADDSGPGRPGCLFSSVALLPLLLTHNRELTEQLAPLRLEHLEMYHLTRFFLLSLREAGLMFDVLAQAFEPGLDDGHFLFPLARGGVVRSDAAVHGAGHQVRERVSAYRIFAPETNQRTRVRGTIPVGNL
mmetsp:Transcript_6503/g.29336  ORF Transcript_6503/g.29336 Transcript_6503/m.29336 type:complete len:251 (-) Transcript_6503:4841-5593(-)